MQKLILSVFIMFLSVLNINAQKGTSYGIKAGVNYSSNGNYIESINETSQSPDRNIGYHFGVYGKIGNRLFLRPELVYTATKSTYNNDEFEMTKLDAPLLIGVKVFGPINVFAGPTLQYIVNSEFDGIDINDIDNDISIGFNFGVGVNINRIGIDLRYERGFSENEAVFIDDNLGNGLVSRIDTRPEQLILSISFAL